MFINLLVDKYAGIYCIDFLKATIMMKKNHPGFELFVLVNIVLTHV